MARLLTAREAADVLSGKLGWPVRAGDVTDAIRHGRLQGERQAGWRRRYLVSEEELLRFVAENADIRASEEDRARAEALEAAAWSTLPRRSFDVLWRVEWKRRAKSLKPPPGTAKANIDEATDRLARDLERLKERGRKRSR